MWTIFYDYYLNAIEDVDRGIQQIVDVMNEMDLWRDTAVVFTADHGEMGGAHGGLKGKGPFVYEENIHVPLIIAHPDREDGHDVPGAHESSRSGSHLRRPNRSARDEAASCRNGVARARLLLVAGRSRKGEPDCDTPGHSLQLCRTIDG